MLKLPTNTTRRSIRLILRRARQLRHLVREFQGRGLPIVEIGDGLLQLGRRRGAQDVTNADLHPADRRFGFRGALRDRLLPRCPIAELLNRSVAVHLEDDHQRDERDGECRGHSELGANSQVLNEHHRHNPRIRIAAPTRVNSPGRLTARLLINVKGGRGSLGRNTEIVLKLLQLRTFHVQ
ncbi:hypothetical protein ABIC01_004168 [Bradyrhizobium sp. RT4b]